MVSNIDNLKDVAPLEINISRIGVGEQVPENILFYTRDALGSIFLDSVTLILFLVLLWKYTDINNPNGFDLARALTISSGWTLSMSAATLLSGWSTNIYPLFLYGVIFAIGWTLTYIQKKKGS